jgi:hypothetical protein
MVCSSTGKRGVNLGAPIHEHSYCQQTWTCCAFWNTIAYHSTVRKRSVTGGNKTSISRARSTQFAHFHILRIITVVAAGMGPTCSNHWNNKYKVLSIKLKEKYQFGYKDADRRAMPKLRHTLNGGKKGNSNATLLAPGVPELSWIYLGVFHCIRC